ncbi:MAG: hypothetical protein QM658_12310 [Gordonia sp. (in: high G+C Gram-positive bacteria)]
MRRPFVLVAAPSTLVVAVLVGGCQNSQPADSEPQSVAHTTGSTPQSVTTTAISLTPVAGKYAAAFGNDVGSSADGSTWNVRTPRVDGGEATVRDAFNDEFTKHVDALVASSDGPKLTLTDGELNPMEKTQTVVGASTLSGVMIVSAFSDGAAHPNTDLATVVVDSSNGRQLTLDSVLKEPSAGRSSLLNLAAAYDTSGRLKDAHPTADEPGRWIALPDGLHLYVPVSHAMGDYVPVTIPWHDVEPLLTSSARHLLVT